MLGVQWAKQHPAEIAWIGLGGYVFSYDLWALLTNKETMSEAYDRGRRGVKKVIEGSTPKKFALHKGWLITATCIMTGLHLQYGDRLKWFDPFHLIALVAKGIELMIVPVVREGER